MLDVNLLMALLWENHEHHERARRWLLTVTEFATCPISRLGFARISSHPMLDYGMSPERAFGVLRRLLADTRHRFVPDDLSSEDRVLLTERIPGSNHVTDHYLAAGSPARARADDFRCCTEPRISRAAGVGGSRAVASSCQPRSKPKTTDSSSSTGPFLCRLPGRWPCSSGSRRMRPTGAA